MSEHHFGGSYAVLPDPVQTVSGGEQVTVETIIANRYRARQMDTFRFLQTTPADWRMCEIKSIDMLGNIIWEVPADFRFVLGFSAIHPDDTAHGCELCGHPIIYPYPIRCDRLKIVMNVGSDCVNNFMGAGYTTKQVKIFKETRLRKIFQNWILSAYNYCTQQREGSFVPTENPHAIRCTLCNSRILNTPENIQSHKGGCRSYLARRMPERFYRYRQKISKMDSVQKISSRKIMNALNEARTLGIPLTTEMDELLRAEDELRAVRLARSANTRSAKTKQEYADEQEQEDMETEHDSETGANFAQSEGIIPA